MGVTKKNGFNPDVILMSNVLKALGHPARLEILSFIKMHPNSSCMQIVEHIPLSQSTISKHLSELKSAKIILGNLKKKNISYELNAQIFNDSTLFLNKFFEENKTKITSKNHAEKATLENQFKIQKNKQKNKSNTDLKMFNHVFKHLKSK